MLIAHCTGVWYTNMGNSFIDVGAMHIWKTILPDADVIFVGDTPRWTAAYKKPGKPAYQSIAYMKPDILSFAGCCLGMNEFPQVLNIIESVRNINPSVKVVFLGAGAWNYAADADVVHTSELMQKADPFLFTSRDDYSFDIGCGKHIYKGIDCGFFVSDAYKPKKIYDDYIVITDYNEGCEFHTFQNLKKIYVYHAYNTPYIHDNNNFFSDIPVDYFRLYANAKAVYSYRVHGCIVSYSYGVPCALLANTDRARLFKKVGIDMDRDCGKLVTPNMDTIREAKNSTLDFLRSHIND